MSNYHCCLRVKEAKGGRLVLQCVTLKLALLRPAHAFLFSELALHTQHPWVLGSQRVHLSGSSVACDLDRKGVFITWTQGSGRVK